MSAPLLIIIVATCAFALTTLGIAVSIDYRDWGLCGLMVLCGGITVLGLATILREEDVLAIVWPDLAWLWLLLACVGGVLVILGQLRRIRSGWSWPPRWRLLARLLGAIIIPFALLALIHLIRVSI